ncbi:MAG: DUF1684 domain-containing protein [Roseiflexaceae bacterium]|nr:DUF1684 domain-containing protein [Roseiflexaceae bacterium]
MTISSIGYIAEIEAWRREIEVALRRDWVSLAGRFELEPGESRIGAHPTSEIALPIDSAPDSVGVITLVDGEVTLTLASDVAVFVNSAPTAQVVHLRSDAAGPPDIVTFGSLTFFIIRRGPRTILRLRDANSPVLQKFGGRRWFAVDETYLVDAVFTPYNPPKPLSITNILGDTSGQGSPGAVTFTLGDQQYQLDATGWRDGGLVLHFHDQTNGKLTYGGGRTLVTSAPVSGLVTLDFNRTSNLPCAFTEFATCPLPPQQNRLPVRIEAGEQRPDLK